MQKIVVIEDHHDVRDNLCEMLELAGYLVEAASNGKEGVVLVKKTLPDLILCDIMMPEIDGYGVLHMLNRDAQTTGIPFIFLTAKAEREDFRRGMALGADDYIIKPFDHENLLTTIENRLLKAQKLKTATTQTPGHFERFVDEAAGLISLKRLAEAKEARHYRKKDAVFKEGETPRWLFWVESGAVKISKISPDGRELIVEVCTAGQFFGYTALLTGEAYTESAAVIEESKLRLIAREDFNTLMAANRDVNAWFIKMLAGHVADKEQQLIDLAYDSVRRRVASALVHLVGKTNSTHIHWLREDLAYLAGTAKETLIRTLADFRNEGLITIQDGVVVVEKTEKLRHMHN